MSNETIAQSSYDFQPFVLSLSGSEASGLIYIEQLAATGCKTPNKPYMIARNENTKLALFFQPTCKLWSCPYCGAINANRWVARSIHGTDLLLAADVDMDFVTITAHEKLNAAQSFYVFPRAWPQLYRRYKRAVPPSDPKVYIAVPEKQPKTGRHHCHLIISGRLGQRWWKDNARECGLGYQSEDKEVSTVSVGKYVGKYLGKTLAEKWPRHKRRINTSRNWPPLPELPEKVGWSFSVMASESKLSPVLVDLSQRGYTVMGVTTKNAWALLDDLSPS
jgi:hypothetical protein